MYGVGQARIAGIPRGNNDRWFLPFSALTGTRPQSARDDDVARISGRIDIHCKVRAKEIVGLHRGPVVVQGSAPGLFSIFGPIRQSGVVTGPGCPRSKEDTAGRLQLGARVESAGRNDRNAAIRPDARQLTSTVPAEHRSEVFGIRQLVTADQLLTSRPFHLFRTQDDVTRMAGSARFAAAAAMTMQQSAEFSLDFVFDRTADAASGVFFCCHPMPLLIVNRC